VAVRGLAFAVQRLGGESDEFVAADVHDCTSDRIAFRMTSGEMRRAHAWISA
jgi:hypothetical protein